MKKIQTYLTKPQELRRKIENPAFQHDFMQWSRSNICRSNSRHYKSKSPSEKLLHHHTSSSKTHCNYNKSKQNIIPNSVSLHNRSASYQHSAPRKNCSRNSLERNSRNQQRETFKAKKKMGGHAKSHAILATNGISAQTIEDMNELRVRQNYSSVRKNRDCNESRNQSQKAKVESQSQVKFNTGPECRELQFRYAYRTRQGVLATNANKKNQDRLLVKTNLGGANRHLFAVADGHGSCGHFVAESIVKNYSSLAETEIGVRKPEQSLPKIYNQLQRLIVNSEINASCSGSTLVSLVLQNSYMTCANVGDSRAILARQVDRKSWEMIYLSQDQKPGIEAERKRILKSGGRIHSLRDQRGESVGPLRVWLPNQNIQGLAMSRSLGDNVSKPYGVTHKPQIIKVPTDKRDKFILIASDGVWQFITNQQVLQLIVPYYRQRKLQQACDALLKLAYERWTVEDTSVVDDITFILIFLGN